MSGPASPPRRTARPASGTAMPAGRLRWRPPPRPAREWRPAPPHGGSRTRAPSSVLLVLVQLAGVLRDARMQADHQAVLAPAVSLSVVVLGDERLDGVAELRREGRAVAG